LVLPVASILSIVAIKAARRFGVKVDANSRFAERRRFFGEKRANWKKSERER
jgi:hypothetical protein